ncbi:MAG: hypothetical protein PVI67_01325 [Anaerolineae bacterium]|jgi:hypothetical protein
MKQRALTIGLVLVLAATVVRAAPGAAPDASPAAVAGAPSVVSYQGQVQVGEDLYDGTGYFKFAIVDGLGFSTWSNDGTSADGSEPAGSVSLPVSDGLFSVLLGDSGMPPLTAAAFGDDESDLHVWFSSDDTVFYELTPATRIAAVPYALVAPWSGISDVPADLADGDDDTTYSAGTGIHIGGSVISAEGSHYGEVVVVAKSGGDYTSIQAAIDAVKGAASYKEPYLVWVAPGLYEGEVVMAPYVHLQGAGREATVLSCGVSGGTIPPKVATLILASNSSVRDLTVLHEGTGYANVAIMAVGGTSESFLQDVDARSEGSGEHNIGVLLNGSGTEVTLENVMALGEYGSSYNYGLHETDGATATVRGGSFTARGGISTRGILNNGSSLDAVDATVLGEGATDQNHGLALTSGAAQLRGGTVSGLGGDDARGINVNNGTLHAEETNVVGDNTGTSSFGLYNYRGTVTLIGGTVTGRGAATSCGVSNDADAATATLSVQEVAVLSDSDGDDTYGLWNQGGGDATLYGGSFGTRGGQDAVAVLNQDSGSALESLEISVLAEGGNSLAGISNRGGATALVHGGSYVARGGGSSCNGLVNRDGSTLEARNVTSLAEGCTQWNKGLFHYNASTVVRGGELSGRGGNSGAVGMDAWAGGTLEAWGVTARAEGSSNQNIGLFTSITDITVASSVLDGADQWVYAGSSSVEVLHSHLIGIEGIGAGLSCLAVTWNGGFYESSCP